jgi:hypothetical protein
MGKRVTRRGRGNYETRKTNVEKKIGKEQSKYKTRKGED